MESHDKIEDEEVSKIIAFIVDKIGRLINFEKESSLIASRI